MPWTWGLGFSIWMRVRVTQALRPQHCPCPVDFHSAGTNSIWSTTHTPCPLLPQGPQRSECSLPLSVVLPLEWLSRGSIAHIVFSESREIISQGLSCLQFIHHPQIKTILSSEIEHRTKLPVLTELYFLCSFTLSHPLSPFFK